MLFYCDEYKKLENFLLYQILLYAFRDVTLVYDNESVNLNRETFSTCLWGVLDLPHPPPPPRLPTPYKQSTTGTEQSCPDPPKFPYGGPNNFLGVYY